MNFVASIYLLILIPIFCLTETSSSILISTDLFQLFFTETFPELSNHTKIIANVHTDERSSLNGLNNNTSIMIREVNETVTQSAVREFRAFDIVLQSSSPVELLASMIRFGQGYEGKAFLETQTVKWNLKTTSNNTVYMLHKDTCLEGLLNKSKISAEKSKSQKIEDIENEWYAGNYTLDAEGCNALLLLVTDSTEAEDNCESEAGLSCILEKFYNDRENIIMDFNITLASSFMKEIHSLPSLESKPTLTLVNIFSLGCYTTDSSFYCAKYDSKRKNVSIDFDVIKKVLLNSGYVGKRSKSYNETKRRDLSYREINPRLLQCSPGFKATAETFPPFFSCQPCLPGTKSNGAICENCPTGMSSLPQSFECFSCPVGTYSPIAGGSSCLPCEAGTYNNEEEQENCLNCQAGSYSESRATSCILCDEGTWSQERASSCPLCPAGEYNQEKGQANCIKCPVGTYNPTPVKGFTTTCKSCLVGTYNNKEGAKSLDDCLPCEPGYYNGLVNQSKCEKCPMGTFNPEYSKLSKQDCFECPIMMYNNLAAQGMCKNCSAGTYTSVTGSIKCEECYGLCLSCNEKTSSDCKGCIIDVENMAPSSGGTCRCKERYFLDKNQTSTKDLCQPCYELCTYCETRSTYCFACVNEPGIVLFYGQCLCSAPGYFLFHNMSTNKDTCLPCFPLCTVCTGVNSNECDLCNAEAKAVFVSARTCGCGFEYYYDQLTKRCETCDPNCASCFGPSNKQCYACKPSSYVMTFNTSWCFKSCYDIDGFYRLGSFCKNCSKECRNCIGPEDSQCTACSDLNKAVYRGSCIDNCPDHYVSISGVCNECHSSCKNCSDASKAGCLNCFSDRLLFNKQCVITCPAKTYANYNGTEAFCLPCVSPCDTCLTNTTCTRCLRGHYMYNGLCVNGNNCSSDMYPDDDLLMCRKCSVACETCYGPTSKTCKNCNYIKGYGWNSNECCLTMCPESTYLFVNTEKKEAICVSCHEYCKTCIAGTSSDCLECKQGFMITPSNKENTVKCIKCPSGYEITSEGACSEICGDGINLGMVQCDDGNHNDGDGCSAICKVEFGYKCSTSPNGPDVCVNIIPPKATLKLMKGNVLVVMFSKTVITKSSAKELTKYMEVTLTGFNGSCGFTWSLNETFGANKELTKLMISTFPECSLKNSEQTFIVKFLDSSQILDSNGNPLTTLILKVSSRTFIYKLDLKEPVMANIGTAVNSLSMTTFVIMLGLSIFQSAAVGSFWSFVDLSQLITYVSLLKCTIPQNFQVFISNYLSVKTVTIPFDLLPDFKFNPLNYFKVFITKAFNNKFFMAGYESISFLENFANEMITWIGIGLLYLLLKLLRKLLGRYKYY